MKNLSTWLIVMFMGMFWVLRVIIALTSSYAGKEGFAGLVSANLTVEIILLFVVLVCIALIVKRKMLGAIIYLVAYGSYFGYDAGVNILAIINNGAPIGNILGAVVSIIGIILPLGVLLDMVADSARKANPVDKKTDWFYKNEAFDRKLDERADKNNYRL